MFAWLPVRSLRACAILAVMVLADGWVAETMKRSPRWLVVVFDQLTISANPVGSCGRPDFFWSRWRRARLRRYA